MFSQSTVILQCSIDDYYYYCYYYYYYYYYYYKYTFIDYKNCDKTTEKR